MKLSIFLDTGNSTPTLRFDTKLFGRTFCNSIKTLFFISAPENVYSNAHSLILSGLEADILTREYIWLFTDQMLYMRTP